MRGHAELSKVIEYLNAMNGDSNTSDNSNKQSGHRETRTAIENPFLHIRARGLLLWYPLGFILCGSVFISEEAWQTGKSVANMSLQLWLYYWIYLKSKQGNIDIRLFFDMSLIGAVSPEDPLLKDFQEVAAEIAQSRSAGTWKDRRSAIEEKHDLLGRLIERRNEEGSIERWEYDAEGNETLYIDGDGRAHRKEYTSWNLLHREADPAGNSGSFQYSPTEEMTQFVDAGGVVHDFLYDKKDRLIEVRRDGITFDVYRYDKADNLIEKLDGAGRSLLVCEPGFGSLDRVQRFADGEVYWFEYNKRGQITMAQTRRDRMGIDYDEEGRLTEDVRNGLGVEHDSRVWTKLV